MQTTASKPPRLTHHDLTADRRMRNLFAVAFAGPWWTWRYRVVVHGPTWAQKRRARIDPPSLETAALRSASRTDRRRHSSRAPLARWRFRWRFWGRLFAGRPFDWRNVRSCF